MEMDSLPPANPPETAEAGPSSERPSYKDTQVWKDIEAETGFASCADYLEFYKDVRGDFVYRLREFENMPVDLVTAEKNLPTNQRSSIVIYDISKKENLPISLSLRRHCHLGTELIQALREPSDDVCVQLVLWTLQPESINQEIADTLVMGLKLDLRFLEDLGAMCQRINKSTRRPRKAFRASQINHVLISETLTTISQGANAVPVLLVISLTERFEHVERVLAQDIHETPLVHRTAPGEKRPFGETDINGRMKAGQIFARIVEHFIVQGQSAIPSKAFLLLAATSPLLYYQGHKVRRKYNVLQDTYSEIAVADAHQRAFDTSDMKYKDFDKALDRYRRELRQALEDAEDQASEILRYLGSEVSLDCSKEPSYMSLKADLKHLIDEARRLETKVRDYMQLQVGNLSLEESRRSIELSNLQIGESRSGKFVESNCTGYTNIL